MALNKAAGFAEFDMTKAIVINDIAAVHKMFDLDPPRHPLVSVIRVDDVLLTKNIPYINQSYIINLFQISLKSGFCDKLTYGRNKYDFKEGTLVFTKPGQRITVSTAEREVEPGGWTLLFHPDLIRKSALGKCIEQFSFFSYDSHEALHLSDEERKNLTDLVGKIEVEYKQGIDRHTQTLLVANIELILNYCVRYYDRQFYVRTNTNSDVVARLDTLLDDYFGKQKALELGLPTVAYCSSALHMSSSYLSDMLKREIGKSAQQVIQERLIDRAKTCLLGTDEQISQVAYSLGFEYPQHFSKLFKAKTGLSPQQYRREH